MIKGLKRRFYNVDILVLLLFLISLVIGILVADDYGLSWDEYNDLSYGEIVLTAYKGSEDFLWEGGNREYYGPSYWMFVGIISSFIRSLPFDVQIVYVWKVINFIAFQVGVFSFYYLSKRFTARIPALLTTVLLMTQPLLWGHAFINPKDIPFMSFFLLTAALSLKGFNIFIRYVNNLDALHDKQRISTAEKWRSLRRKWRATSISKKIKISILIALILVVSMELLLLKSIILPMIDSIVRDAYNGESIPLINSLFERIAQDSYKTPVSLYLEKIYRLYNWSSWLFVLFLMLVGYYSCRVFLGARAEKIDWRDLYKRIFIFLIPGIFLGLTLSIRIPGLFVGVLFSAYFLYRVRERAIIPLLFYWSIAGLVMIATWPYLWNSTIPRLLKAIKVVGSYTTHETLFQGQIYRSLDMPIHYLPFLILIQLTEPTLVLFVLGFFQCVNIVRKNKERFGEVLFLTAWLVIPILAEILFHIPIYDNFRQFLFILPPLFLFASFGVTFLLKLFGDHQIIAIILVIIILLPGIVGIINLHPYEYVYYNSLVGGTSSVYGEYELDYWCTSLREAIEFLNEYAEPNSYVYLSGPPAAAEPFAREDIKITTRQPGVESSGYAVGCRSVLLRDDYYPNSKVIHEVGIEGAAFSVVKELVSSK
jgi:hypothetical protein